MKAFILSRAGRYRDAENMLSHELELAHTDGAQERVAGAHLLVAILAIEQRAYERALGQIAMAEESVGSLPPSRKRRYLVAGDMLGGIAELKLGYIDRAKSRFDLLTKRYASDHQGERWWRSVLQAEIALASGDGRQAIRTYEDAEAAKTVKITMMPNAVTWIMASNLPFRDGIARAKAAQGDLAGAIDAYTKLLTPGPHQKWIGLYEPRYVLEIARLLDRTGDKVGARTEYQRFLHLWENADSDLLELAEARRGSRQ
jgi:tetratricopeptide (TPR) repeat protein